MLEETEYWKPSQRHNIFLFDVSGLRELNKWYPISSSEQANHLRNLE
jgi:hypothetical protein